LEINPFSEKINEVTTNILFKMDSLFICTLRHNIRTVNYKIHRPMYMQNSVSLPILSGTLVLQQCKLFTVGTQEIGPPKKKVRGPKAKKGMFRKRCPISEKSTGVAIACVSPVTNINEIHFLTVL
jgi:hypothetical protein